MLNICHFGTINRDVFRAIWAEYFMAFFYTYVGCGSILNLAFTVPGSALAQVAAAALAFGFVTVAIGYIFGHVSIMYGNPALTIAFLLFNRVSLLRGIFTIIFQIAGGITAAALLYATWDSVSESCNYIPSIMSRGEALLLEIILTSIVALAVFHNYSSYPPGWIPRSPSRTDVRDPDVGDRDRTGYGDDGVWGRGAPRHALLHAVGVGLTVAAVHFASMVVTRTGINPARAFGPAVISGSTTITGNNPDGTVITRNCWNGHWVWWVGPILGAILGGLIYKFFIQDNYQPKDAAAQPAVVRRAPAGNPQYGVTPAMHQPAGNPPFAQTYVHGGPATASSNPATAI